MQHRSCPTSRHRDSQENAETLRPVLPRFLWGTEISRALPSRRECSALEDHVLGWGSVISLHFDLRSESGRTLGS